jgi:hypothetical protein
MNEEKIKKPILVSLPERRLLLDDEQPEIIGLESTNQESN